jgi:hypothetical protein
VSGENRVLLAACADTLTVLRRKVVVRSREANTDMSLSCGELMCSCRPRMEGFLQAYILRGVAFRSVELNDGLMLRGAHDWLGYWGGVRVETCMLYC